MLSSFLGNLFGGVAGTKKIPPSNILDRTKKRKLIVRKFKGVDPNNNLKRAKIAKELLSVSRTEGERRAARKFYKDEIALNNLKNRIKASDSINEKLSLARQGKRLSTKQQKEFWENLVNKLQKKKQEKKDVVKSEKKTLTTDTDKEQDTEKDMKEIKEGKIEEKESEENSDNNTEEVEETEEGEGEMGENEENEDEGEGDNDDNVGEDAGEDIDDSNNNDNDDDDDNDEKE